MPFVVSLSNHALRVNAGSLSAGVFSKCVWFDRLTTNGMSN